MTSIKATTSQFVAIVCEKRTFLRMDRHVIATRASSRLIMMVLCISDRTNAKNSNTNKKYGNELHNRCIVLQCKQLHQCHRRKCEKKNSFRPVQLTGIVNIVSVRGGIERYRTGDVFVMLSRYLTLRSCVTRCVTKHAQRKHLDPSMFGHYGEVVWG